MAPLLFGVDMGLVPNGSHHGAWHTYYDRNSAQRVAEYMELDFDAFGYRIDSWKEGDDA